MQGLIKPLMFWMAVQSYCCLLVTSTFRQASNHYPFQMGKWRLERMNYKILLQSTVHFGECFVVLLFRDRLDLTIKYNFSLNSHF